MNIWKQCVDRPQSLWLRKALFQIHLWTGIALGLYVFVICVSGSAAVFNSELYTAFLPDTKASTNRRHPPDARPNKNSRRANAPALHGHASSPAGSDPHFAATVSFGGEPTPRKGTSTRTPAVTLATPARSACAWSASSPSYT